MWGLGFGTGVDRPLSGRIEGFPTGTPRPNFSLLFFREGACGLSRLDGSIGQEDVPRTNLRGNFFFKKGEKTVGGDMERQTVFKYCNGCQNWNEWNE